MSSPVTIPMRTLPSPSQVASNFDHRVGTASDVNATGVRSDFDPSLDTRWQDSAHQRNEVFRVTRIRIAGLLLLHDRHRHFREIVEHEVIDWSTFNLTHGSVRKISPEALSGCYAYFCFIWGLECTTN